MTDAPQHKPALKDMIDYLTVKRDSYEVDSDEYLRFDSQVSAAELADIIVDSFGSSAMQVCDAVVQLAVATPQVATMVIRSLAAALKFYETGLSETQKRINELDSDQLAALIEMAK